ncbi:MAG: DNA polymerase III subunit beta [Psychrobacillus sp.]
MKISIENKVLLEVLTQVWKFRGKEIQQNILFTATEEGFTFQATDGEVTYVRHLPLVNGEQVNGKVEVAGEILLPLKFEQIARKLEMSTLSLEVKENELLVKQAKTTAKVVLIKGEFPTVPKGEKGEGLRLSKEALALLVNQTAFSAADHDSRPVLKAIHMEAGEDGFKIIATDSHRLSQKLISNKINLPTLNIPAKKLSNVIDTIEEGSSIDLIPYGNYILLVTPNSEIYIRQLEGTYPDVSKLVINKAKSKVKVKSKEMLSAIDRALTFVKSDNNRKITMKTEDNLLKMFSSADEGSIEQFIDVEVEGEAIDITFNANYAVAAIKSFQQETITFHIEDTSRPFFILSDDDPTLTQLVLPVRTK